MKKLKVIKILFILFIILVSILTFTKNRNIETNLLRAFLNNNAGNELLVNLSGKYSSNINVIFEGNDDETIEYAKTDFLSNIDKNFFTVYENNSEQFLNFYKQYKNSLLSDKDYKNLKNGKFNIIKENAINNLYNPFGFSILNIEEDPFQLFTNYITSLEPPTTNYNDETDKTYEILKIKVNEKYTLSPSIINKEVKKLTSLQNKLSNEDVTIYLTGTPIHSYYASAKSIKEINILCTISLIFVSLVIFLYFRSFKIIFPILGTLILGMFDGYCITSLLFDKVHILTFVFSTTLIGICVDYTLHYFMEQNIKHVIKSLTVSMLSTVCALMILTLSQIELLKQIGIFTSVGLITVYLAVVLFYPSLKVTVPNPKTDFHISKKIVYLLIPIIAIGLIRLKFDDDIRNMYQPSKNLIQAEKIYNNINGQNNTSFLITNEKTFEDTLQAEEQIREELNNKNIQYVALSKFIPSKKRQQENFRLIKTLYNLELNSLSDFISTADKEKLKELSLDKILNEDSITQIPQLKDFIINPNQTAMILYNATPKDIPHVENAKYINIPNDISQEIKNIRKTCIKLFLPVFAALFLVLGLVFKFKNALKIVLPTLISSLSAITIIGIFQPINMFHILAIFLIIGFGLDYSIFRFNGSQKSQDAVFLSCLTTVFSFFMLAMTSFKLIASMGIILSIGLALSYITSLALIKKDTLNG